MRADITKIKDSITCVQAAKWADLPINRAGDRCKSFIHEGNNSNSVVVYDDYWYSFSDSKGGDVIDLVALSMFGGNRGEAIKYMAPMCGAIVEDTNNGWEEYTHQLNSKVAKWNASLLPQHLDYLHSRNINDTTIREHMIGWNGSRIVIPMFKNGYVCYYIARAWGNDKPKYLKPKLDGYLENDIFGLQTLNRNYETLVIAEGAFDYLSFYQEGYPVIATCGGNFNKTQTKRVVSICKNYKQVMLTFDNDGAGNTFTVNMAKTLYANNVPFVCARIPKGYKDISEYYVDTHTDFRPLVDSAQNGLEWLCSQFDTIDELSSFIRPASRFMTKTQISTLFLNLEKGSSIPLPLLKSLQKECISPPSEIDVLGWVKENHKLLYVTGYGFYEYNGKYWELIEDLRVTAYAKKEYGYYATASKCEAVMRMLRSDCLSEEKMNNKPVVNFVNGTIYLKECGIDFMDKPPLHDHSSDDRCAYMLPYPYDPNATCQSWLDYIADVTNGDSADATTLQQFAGYVLYPDCSLQKALLLLGEGSNGKSVYLNTIESLYGGSDSGNVSTVEMTMLGEKFYPIMLATSLLNISTEVSTSLPTAESIFKAVVAGDSVTSSYKGKDNVSFRPRSKMFIAANDLPQTRDVSEGWFRRFALVRFNMHYTDHPSPDNPNDRYADRTLLSRLTTTESLSGIFNWALVGYMDLRNTGTIEESDQSKSALNDYMEIANPLIGFAAHISNSVGSYSNQEIYDLYRKWCMDMGLSHPKSAISFHRDFARVMPKNIIKFRSSSKKGYEIK